LEEASLLLVEFRPIGIGDSAERIWCRLGEALEEGPHL